VIIPLQFFFESYTKQFCLFNSLDRLIPVINFEYIVRKIVFVEHC